MYQEQKVNFNWKSFLLKFLLFVIVLILVIKLLPINKKTNKKDHSDIFTSNIESFKEIANDYFTKENLPQVEGGKYKITLKDLVSIGAIKPLKTLEGDLCDDDASFVEVVKKGKEFKTKLHLVCGDEEETLNYNLKALKEEPTTEKTTEKTTEPTTVPKPTTKPTIKPTIKPTTKPTTAKTTKPIQKTLVIFNSSGGTEIPSQHINKGSIPKRPKDPVRYGYDFIGWYNQGVLYNFNSAINNTTILLAKWKLKEESNQVTFDSNGGTYVKPINIKVGERITKPVDPYRVNARFIGWYDGDRKFDFNTRVYENITLKAKWLVKEIYLQDVYIMGYGRYDYFNHYHSLKTPSVLNNVNNRNIELKSISKINNISSNTDLYYYKNLYNNTISYHDQVPYFNYQVNNIARLVNVNAVVTNGEINWYGTMIPNCQRFYFRGDYVCGYGITYEAKWEYERIY